MVFIFGIFFVIVDLAIAIFLVSFLVYLGYAIFRAIIEDSFYPKRFLVELKGEE